MKALLYFYGSIIFIMILLLSFGNAEPTQNNSKPPKFKSNYQIDLKQDGYLILNQEGKICSVPIGQLEDWFLDDNL